MTTAVLVAWRSTDCPHRTRALAYVTARYGAEHSDWPVIIGRHDTGPWCKALAVADALQRTSADVLVVADADCFTDGLPDAVDAVEAGAAAWAVPHRGVFRLTEAATARYIAGEPLENLALTERAYRGVEGGGITVVRRDAYEDCPLDERFTGWGQEDHAWGLALRTLHGPEVRIKKPLAHLWHPPQTRDGRRNGSPAGKALELRYANARRDPAAMRRLIQEDRSCRSPLCSTAR